MITVINPTLLSLEELEANLEVLEAKEEAFVELKELQSEFDEGCEILEALASKYAA